ncbi:DUF6687 family protein [Nonomuraea turcica]|uniref:DUF6687 family protein n=1 Tax=Nonomuraea sp. G32 TaxID=3067274 RepID=UPI00353040A9
MKYLAYTPELAEIDKILVDGNEAGRGLQLSHWPGNRTPKHLKADLSVEIALRFIADPGHSEWVRGREIVTNDHYDTDGLLAAWVVLNPESAAEHAAALIACAEAGDFYEFTHPDAVKLDLTIQAFADPERSPFRVEPAGASTVEFEQRASDEILARLPGLLYDVSDYEELWGERYEKIVGRLGWLNDGRVRVREWPEARMSTIESSDRLDHFARNTFCNGHRILEAVSVPGGTSYVLHYREFLWYDIVSRASSPKHRMTRTADRLNELEPAGDGAWAVTTWTPAILFSAEGKGETRVVSYKEPRGASALPVETVEQVICEELLDLDRA